MNSQFEYKIIEKKWQDHWENSGTVKVLKSDKPKFYNLCMYPYPSRSAYGTYKELYDR